MADQNAALLQYDLVPSPQLQAKLQRQFADLEKSLKFRAPFGAATREVKTFASELDRANQRVITLGASFAVLATSIRTLKDIVRSTIEVEKAFTEINAVFQLSSQGLDRFSKQLFDAARTTGQSFQKAADAAKEFSRQGLTAQETIRRTTDALILTRLANLDTAKAVETLTASINGFQKSALSSTEIVNKLATVDARFAVSSSDLAEALSRAGAAASDAGVSFDQLIGLVTAAQQTTARGGAVIGNALKTIFTRIERRDTIDAFESLGVQVRDSSGAVLSAIPLLQNFAKTYDGLNGAIKKQAAEMVGGVYQINILKAVLGDLAKAQGIAAQATDVSRSATNEAILRNEALNKSLDSLLTKFGVTAKQIGSNVGSQSFAGPLKNVLGFLTNNPITAALQDASGKAETEGGKFAEKFLQGAGGAIVFGLGPLIAKALGKIVFNTGGNLLRDFRDLTGIAGKSKENATLQQQIVALYRAGGAALQNQLASMSSITSQAALLQRLLSTPGTFSPARMAQAVAQLRTPKAAGGYIPMAEESAAISAGIGGAPAGARPVFLPTFNRGGGQRGIVANTSEFIVPGAAGGAIFNREMIKKFGLPPGATPVAAGGFIPNAAASFQPGDLSLQPGKVGTFPFQGKALDNLNELFKTLATFPDKPAAYETSEEIRKVAKTFDDLSKSKVLTRLKEEMATLAFRSRIVTDQRRQATPEMMAAYMAERQANAGFGDDYNDYLRRRDGGGAMRRPSLPPPPPPSWTQRNLPTFSRMMPRGMSRLRGAFNSQNAQYAAAFGLPFFGSMIDEGQGGTGRGITRGVLGSGLTGAGFGASIGMSFGGPGALIGGGAGLLIGGAVGALRKMEESFEELAAEINEANAKIQRQVEFVQSAFRLQGDVIASIQNGASPGKIDELRRARTQAILSVSDPKVRSQLIANINNPDGLSEITDTITAQQRKNQLGENIRGSTRRALDTSRFTRGAFGYKDGTENEIANALLPALKALSRDELIRVGQVNAFDPRMAFSRTAASAGLDGDQIASLTSRYNDGTRDLFQRAISKALHDLANSGILEVEEASKKAEESMVKFQKSLRELSSDFRFQSQVFGLRSGAAESINRAREEARTSRGDLTDDEILARRGITGAGEIRRRFADQRTVELGESKAALIDALGGGDSKDSRALRDRLSGINSLGSLQKLQADLNTPEGRAGLPGIALEEFKDALTKRIETMQLLDQAELTQLDEIEQITALRRKELARLRTFQGAQDQDSGDIKRAFEALEGAKARKESPQAVEQAAAAYQSALIEQARRNGTVTIGGQTFKVDQGNVDKADFARSLRLDQNRGQDTRDAILNLAKTNPELLKGEDIGGAIYGNAQRAGQTGDAKGSFLGGFRSSIESAKRDLLDFSEVGRRVADNLHSSGVDAWTSWVTGAKRGKDAFKEFVASVLADASRMMASKAFSAALSAIPGFSGFGSASGGRLGFAGGGMVPAMLTGGEYVVGPQAARKIGYDTLRRLNGYNQGGEVQHLAGGGMVRGGSGVKDDVPANLPSGSFVIKKSAVQRLGPSYLDSLANGRVQNRFWGGLLLGGLLGGGIGYATGGTKGALIGGLLGGIGGGLLQNYSQTGSMFSAGKGAGMFSFGSGANVSVNSGNALLSDAVNKGSWAEALSGASPWKKALYGFGASAALGALAGIAGKKSGDDSGAMSLDQVPGYRARLEAEQMSLFSGRGAGKHAFLEINPQGGYSLAGFGDAPATRRWATGGGVDVPMSSGPSIGGNSGAPQVHIQIDINNNGGVSSKSDSSGGDGAFGTDFASKMEKQIRGVVQDELVRQSRPDGFFSQRSRFTNNY